LEVFILETLKIFTKKKWFDKINHDVCLKMHTYLVNALFKNGKYAQSLIAAEQLKQEMDNYNGILEDKYAIFYYNALVINYSVINPKEAIVVLETLKEKYQKQEDSFYHNFIYINLAIVYYRHQSFEKSIDQIIQLGTKDSFKKAAPMLQLKLSVLELIIRMEMNEMQVIEYRISQVMRQFKGLFGSEEGIRQKSMLNIIAKMAKVYDSKSRKKVKDMLQLFVDSKNTNIPDDADLIDYFRWARQKMDKLAQT
jgi:tetratricopeptide (TPR) repeat protein